MLIQILILTILLIILILVLIAVRKDRFRGGSTLGNALQEFYATIDPGMRHTIAEKQKEHIKEDESGDPSLDVES